MFASIGFCPVIKIILTIVNFNVFDYMIHQNIGKFSSNGKENKAYNKVI